MLKVVVPVFIVAVGLVLLVSVWGGRGLVRGIAEDMLVSPAKPAVAVAPEAAFHLVDARRAEVSPPVQGSPLPATSVQLLYALYQRNTGTVPARLVSLLALAEQDHAVWPVHPEKPAGLIRRQPVSLAGLEGLAETVILPNEKDPWRATEEEPLWEQGSLIRRYTFLLWLHKAKLIVEYREPLPRTSLPLADDLPRLAAFEQRALESFQIRSGKNLPRPQARLPYPPESVQRRELTSYIGDLWQGDNNR